MGKSKKSSNATVVRIHKTKNYTIMSNSHLFNKPPLSLKAKGLLTMFFALPEKWNYSIAGITSICKESIDCIKTTLNELKDFGYLRIEKIMPNESKSGRIEYIYNIYETRQIIKKQEGENPPLEQEGENQTLEFQAFEKQEVEKPRQTNTYNEITNDEDINKENICENVFIFTHVNLFNLYKEICVSFPQPREITAERKAKAIKRIKKQPLREFWETVCKKAEASEICKKYNWFTFNWLIENDDNPLKVYEGNYDNKPTDGKSQKNENNFLPVIKIREEKEAKEQEKLKKVFESIKTREQALDFICARLFTMLGTPQRENEFWDRSWVITLKETYGIIKAECYQKLNVERDV